jgi:hypothetical protein
MLGMANESVIDRRANQALEGSQKEGKRDSTIIGAGFGKLFL